MTRRVLSGMTLGQVSEEIASTEPQIWGGQAWDLKFNLEDDDPYISINGEWEVPADIKGLSAIADFAKVPHKFIERIEPDEQQWILTTRLNRLAKPDCTVYFSEAGIHEVRPAGENRASVSSLVDGVLNTMPEDSPVDDWWSTSQEFRMDVIFPEDSSYSYGDPEVGDITRGGVRVGQDRQHNLAPYVQPYLYRLTCTNGLEVPDYGIRVEARKCNAMQIAALFEHEVSRAVSRLEGDLRAFYDLRNQRITDPQNRMLKVAREAGLADRVARDLATTLPEDADTMFDLVNHLTERANHNPRSTAARKLQIAGGTKVYDHSRRCEACFSRLEL